MSPKVHKFFALYSLNQSQLHKRYPPVEIGTGSGDKKMNDGSQRLQPSPTVTTTMGIGMYGIHFLILGEVL